MSAPTTRTKLKHSKPGKELVTETASDQIPTAAELGPPGQNELRVTIPKDGDREKVLALSALDPTVRGAAVTMATSSRLVGSTGIMGNINALKELIAEVQGGDMRQADAMLVTQAYTADIIATECLRMWSHNQFSNHPAALDYLRLGLKAQSQTRAHWEAIARVHSPGPTYVKQANIANGPQQVNNHGDGGKNPPNELLEPASG